MYRGIAVFGLNGSGKSTLTHALAKQIGYWEMDVEDYYFPHQKASRYMALEHQPHIPKNTDSLPFSLALPKNEVQQRLIEDIGAHPHFILCGVAMNWCAEILSKIDIAFWIQTPKENRLDRIAKRELLRFGQRVLPGGDMYAQQKAFREAAAGRDLKSLEESAAKLSCPIYMIDGMRPIQENTQYMQQCVEAI